MTSSLVRTGQRLCVLNNAELCDAICRSHGVPGIFSTEIWLQPRDGPAYHPNLITLLPAGPEEQYAAIDGLRAVMPKGFSLKDSFDCLDLSRRGLRKLFEAQWIWLEPGFSRPFPNMRGDTHWTKVETAANLEKWEAAWAGNNPSPNPVFLPSLLRDETVSILSAGRDGEIAAGCIANRDRSKVTGFSNFFAPAAERDKWLAEAVGQVGTIAGGGPVAGYEKGEDLTAMLALGFRAAGPLSVWISTISRASAGPI
jgi:hypothetical protein